MEICVGLFVLGVLVAVGWTWSALVVAKAADKRMRGGQDE